MTVRTIAGEVYKFRPYPLKQQFGDSKLYDLGTHLFVQDVESALEMEQIGKPISIFEAYLAVNAFAVKNGYELFNVPFGEMVQRLGYYVVVTPGDLAPIRFDV